MPELVRSRIINSIRKQRYPRKELILIGESCPHLSKLAEGLSDWPELEHFMTVNIERPDDELCVWALVARARNAGIQRARGEYICCQDDDNELVPQFTDEMLRVMQERNAMAVWCWRRMLEPDGTPFSGSYFPWIDGDEMRRRILYKIWTEAGVIVPGSCVVRDNLWAPRGSERFSTVDPNEWLVHREAFRLVPYRERYTHTEICYHITFDDLWDSELCRSGLAAACWEEPGLIYHLGGASNSRPPADTVQ